MVPPLRTLHPPSQLGLARQILRPAPYVPRPRAVPLEHLHHEPVLLAQALRQGAMEKLSNLTPGQHMNTVQLLVQAAQERATREGVYVVAQVTAGDVTSVMERLCAAAGAVAEVRRETRDNEVFVGGLWEGLEEVAAAGGGDEMGMVFTIPMLGSVR
jgi:hypothetical protein